MILQIYAGRKLILDIVPFEECSIEEIHGKKTQVWTAVKDKFAIPGGSVKSEKDIQKWAKEYGYSIKRIYQQGDLDANNLLP